MSIDTWLLVIPQIIARIHTHNTDVRKLIHNLLVKIGRHHPQASGAGPGTRGRDGSKRAVHVRLPYQRRLGNETRAGGRVCRR